MARERRDTYVLMLSVFPSLIIGNLAGVKTGNSFTMVMVTCGVLMVLYLLIDRLYPREKNSKGQTEE